jgi:hypothetical protein
LLSRIGERLRTDDRRTAAASFAFTVRFVGLGGYCSLLCPSVRAGGRSQQHLAKVWRQHAARTDGDSFPTWCGFSQPWPTNSPTASVSTEFRHPSAAVRLLGRPVFADSTSTGWRQCVNLACIRIAELLPIATQLKRRGSTESRVHHSNVGRSRARNLNTSASGVTQRVSTSRNFGKPIETCWGRRSPAKSGR